MSEIFRKMGESYLLVSSTEIRSDDACGASSMINFGTAKE